MVRNVAYLTGGRGRIFLPKGWTVRKFLLDGWKPKMDLYVARLGSPMPTGFESTYKTTKFLPEGGR